MKVIWKYKIYPTEEQKLDIPENAKLLDVQIQDGEPCLWVLVNPEGVRVDRIVSVIPTGQTKESINGEYAGTFQLHDGVLVFHVFID